MFSQTFPGSIAAEGFNVSFCPHRQRSQVSRVFAGVRGTRDGPRNALQTPFPLRMYTALAGQGKAHAFVLQSFSLHRTGDVNSL